MKLKKGVACLILAMTAGAGLKMQSASSESLFSIGEILSPVWEGTTSYDESVLVVSEADGSVSPVGLLYPIGEILSVKSASLTTVYEEGADYSVSEGKLIVNPDGKIPVLGYSDFHPATGTAGFESRDGGYVLWKEGSWFHSRQIVVTYTHDEGYAGYVPEGKGRLLENTLRKLEGEELNLLVYGDSISTGANSSGHPDISVSPYMPIYPKLFAEGVKLLYGVETVNVYNASVGGTDSAWGLSNLRGGVLDKYEDVDLAILAFGMNDTTREAESYASNMQRMAKGLKTKYKDVDVIVVAPMLPNCEAVKFWGNQADFYGALKGFETQGLVAVDVTGVHAGLLEYKRYADMTGNNINHANDYLARVYAQVLLKTLEVSDYGKPTEPTDSSSAGSDASDSVGASAGSSAAEVSGGSADGGCGSAAGLAPVPISVVAALAAIKRKGKKRK